MSNLIKMTIFLFQLLTHVKFKSTKMYGYYGSMYINVDVKKSYGGGVVYIH